eukprot:5232429-Amphidinium_carterae.1
MAAAFWANLVLCGNLELGQAPQLRQILAAFCADLVIMTNPELGEAPQLRQILAAFWANLVLINVELGEALQLP